MAIVATKKYVKRNGKRYGPYPQGEDYYLYEATKVKGKVHMRYMGVGPKPINHIEKILEPDQQLERIDVSEIHDYDWWSDIDMDLDFLELTNELYRVKMFKEINEAFAARSSMASFTKDMMKRADGNKFIKTLISGISQKPLFEITEKVKEEMKEGMAESRKLILDIRRHEHIKRRREDLDAKRAQDNEKTKPTIGELYPIPANPNAISDSFKPSKLDPMYPKKSNPYPVK